MRYGEQRSFLQRYSHEARGAAVIAGTLAFFAAYSVFAPVRLWVDKALDPAVEGLAFGYGRLSTAIYHATGLNLGFVSVPPDQEFLFSVRLASYINERHAGPLLDLAVDPRVPREKRERALKALLKFESTADWIQPFLNELAKGGLLFDDQGKPLENTPILDQLVARVRAEGGVRPNLVRAYAEVVVSFMLQHPDLNMRRHALKWVSDLLAEDAVFLLVPRLEREKDPAAQQMVETALFDLRAISDPEAARELLQPFYRKPPWPGARIAVAAVLARLGHPTANDVLVAALESEDLSSEERSRIRIAMAGAPFPRALAASPQQNAAAAAREAQRQQQVAAAMERRRQILDEAKAQQVALARAQAVEAERVVAAQREADRIARETAEREALARSQEEARKKAEAEAARSAAQKTPAPQVASLPTPAPSATVPTPSSKPAAVESSKPAVAAAPKPSATPAAKPAAEKPAVAVERVPPRTFPVPGSEAAPPAAAAKPVAVARLPEEASLPPIEETPRKKPKSLMNYVDVVFEVKQEDVPLYQNPGYDGPTGAVLPVGSKGKANFEVIIGEDKWYQVKSKAGSGWANGALLSVFNLSPEGVTPAAATKTEESGRKESTYFEAADENVAFFEKASPKAKKLGVLSADTPYLALRSEKVGPDRWFLLQIRSDETGWVSGVDVRLAEVTQPAQMEIPTGALSQRGKKSSFTAEWVVPGTKGVGVYSRPSIAGALVRQINPPDVYKVVDLQAGNGQEWYRIELPNKKEGWVQAMDVKLTKTPE